MPATDSLSDVRSILATRLDGLGDIVLGVSLLAGLRQRWPDARITLLVRPPHGGIGAILPAWVRVVELAFDPRRPIDRPTAEVAADLRAAAQQCQADLCIIGEYNRVWAGELIAELCGARQTCAFSGPSGLNLSHQDLLDVLAVRVDPASYRVVECEEWWPESRKYVAMIHALGGADPPPPELVVSPEARARAVDVWREIGLAPERTVIFFPSSGDALNRGLTPATWVALIAATIRADKHSALLLGGAGDAAGLETIAAAGLPDAVRRYVITHGDFALLAALLDSAGAYIGADTGPMHVAAALGRPTLGIFGGGFRAQRFLPVGPRTLAIRMPLGCYGCGWFCPFTEYLCLRQIPRPALEAAVARLLAGEPAHDVWTTQVIDVPPPATLHPELLGAVMDLHRRCLDLNHVLMEYRSVHQTVQQNVRRNRSVLAEMTTANTARDLAIAETNRVLAEMSAANAKRDQALAHCGATFDEFTRANARRDEALATLGAVLPQVNVLLDEVTDLRRRSIRVPRFVVRLLRALRRRPVS